MPKTTPASDVPAPVVGPSCSTNNNATPAITVGPGVKPPAIQQPRGTGTWNNLPAPTASSSSPVPPTPTPRVANGGQARKRGEPERDDNAPATARPKRQRTTSAKPLSAIQVAGRADPVGTAGSKKAEVSNDEVELTGAEPAPDVDRLTPAEVEEVIAAWEKSVCDVQSRVMAASVQDKRLVQDLDHAYLGSAYIRFIGLGDVFSVVNLEKDHKSPIFLAVNGEDVDEDTLVEMRTADAWNVLSKLLPLVLKRPNAKTEAQLEEELWMQRVDGRWLLQAELNTRQGKLNTLRGLNSCGMAHILNGSHRTHATLRQNPVICARRDAIRAMIEKNLSNQNHIEREMEELSDMVKNHAWQCLVYDSSKLSKTAHNYLVHNTHKRPAMGMGPGEKAWWLAQKFEMEIQELMTSTNGTQWCSRAEAANIVQKCWCKEIGMKMTMTGKDAEADEPQAQNKSHAKHFGDLAGTNVTLRLFYNPLSMEMVLDVPPTLWAFGELIDKLLAVKMLQPSGGPLIAHVWLALRTLLTLTNVFGGDRLEDAKSWLRHNKKITLDGYEEATAHFHALHVRTERVPQLLLEFGKEEADLFSNMYQMALENFNVGGRINYDANNVKTAIQVVFDKFARSLLSNKDAADPVKKLVASIQLYAWLPMYKLGRVKVSFYPMAALPSMAIKDSIVQRWTGGWSVPQDSDCLVVLKDLIEEGQMIWTVGAQGLATRKTGTTGPAVCTKSSYGYWPAILLARLKHDYPRCVLSCGADPRLPMAFKSVVDFMSNGETLDDLAVLFCTCKTAKFNHEGVKWMLKTSQPDHGSYEDVAGLLVKAWCAIKALAWDKVDEPASKDKKARKTPALSLNKLLCKNPVFGLVHGSFWEHAWLSWFVGWGNAKSKQMGSAGMGLGWALMQSWFVDQQLPKILKDKAARWLLEVASRLLRLTSRRTWWREKFSLNDLPQIPLTLPGYLQMKPREITLARKTRKKERKSEKVRAVAEVNNADPEQPSKNDAPSKKADKKAAKKTAGTTTKRATRAKPVSKPTINDKDEEIDPPKSEGESMARVERGLNDKEDDEEGVKSEAELEAGESGDGFDLNGEDGTEDTDEGRQNDSMDLDAPVPGGEHGGDGASTNPGINNFCCSFKDCTALANNGVGFAPAVHQFSYFHKSAIAQPPNHILAPPIVSTLLPHNTWRQLADTRDKMALEELLESFSNERITLRQLLVGTLICMNSMESSIDIATMLMSDMQAGFKDVFIVRCAKALMSVVWISEEEAIMEGRISVDLTPTFPKALQDQVAGRCVFYGDQPLATDPDRQQTWQLMQFLVLARGLGRTQKESTKRGILAVEHQQVQTRLCRLAPHVVHGLLVDTSQPVPQPDLLPCFEPLDGTILTSRSKEWKSVGPAMVCGTEHSPVSMGDFLGGASWHGLWLRTDDGKEFKAKRVEQSKRYNAIWQEAAKQELAQVKALNMEWEINPAQSVSQSMTLLKRAHMLDNARRKPSTPQRTSTPASSLSLGALPRNSRQESPKPARKPVILCPDTQPSLTNGQALQEDKLKFLGNQEAAKAEALRNSKATQREFSPYAQDPSDNEDEIVGT
ncbi:hypothetical protein FRC07_001585 [Ceratobasidium sp. 392]|nr:hypothetical protein FRC07_001585 [Ceratobasidium sp. 392]